MPNAITDSDNFYESLLISKQIIENPRLYCNYTIMLEEDIRYRYAIILNIDTLTTPVLYPILCIHVITALKYISVV